MTNDVRLRLSIDGAAQVSSELAGVHAGVDRVALGVQKLGHYGAAGLAGLLGVQGLAAAAGSFVRTSDAVTQLSNQLKLSSSSAQAAASAYGQLFSIAQQSRLSFTELGGTYARIARSTSELGISQARLLTVTQAIGNAVVVSGSSAQAANAALVQLGQGMASGVLRGEELNSVMEQTPRLARAIADGLGVTIGELRKMGEAGELSAKRVVAALESQAGVLGKEAAESATTMAQAFTQLGNAATLLVGQLNKTTGASNGVASTLGVFTRGAQAVAEAMAIAERNGGGLFRQLNDGAGMLMGRTLGLQLINRDFMTLQGAADDARAAIARIDEQERRQGKLSIYSMSERAEAMRDLARASRELARANPSQAGSGSVRSGDTALASAEAADLARRQKLANEALKKYATPGEKLGEELQRLVGELGDQFTPELQRRITEHFIKPTNGAAAAAKQAAQALKEALSARALFNLKLQDDAEQTASAAGEAADRAEKELQSRRDLARLKRIDDAEAAAEKAAEAEIGAQKKAAAQAAEEWQRASDQIGQSLSDALLGGAQSAAQAMVNLFRTIVLRPVIQAVVGPVAGTLTSALGFSGAANAAGGASGGASGGIGNALSLLGAGASAFGGTLATGAAATLGGTSLFQSTRAL